MMKTTKTMLTALFVLSSILVVGGWVLASEPISETSTGKNVRYGRHFSLQMGNVTLHRNLDTLISNLNLTTSQKSELEQLISNYKEERKVYLQQKAVLTTKEEKEKLKSDREQRKLFFKNQILALIPSDQRTKLESLFIKTKGRGDLKSENTDEEKKAQKKRNTLGFLWWFLDENQLSETQKSEIQLLQQQKHEQMKNLLMQMNEATSEDQKNSIEDQLEGINQDFLMALKNYISSDKLDEYEQFIAEMKVWNKKTGKKSDRSTMGTATFMKKVTKKAEPAS